MRVEPIYNPLDKKNLGISVADALLQRDLGPLPPAEPFLGAGIYAVYYGGDFPPYQRISLRFSQNRQTPIYVGKAIPAGGRKGAFSVEAEPGMVLYNRLKDHAESVQAAENLHLSDFACRYLAVDDIWIPLGENLLIQMFAPLWNRVVEGFGNHDPGKGRYEGQRPPWDMIHPGRYWAERLRPNKKSADEIFDAIARFLNGD